MTHEERLVLLDDVKKDFLEAFEPFMREQGLRYGTGVDPEAVFTAVAFALVDTAADLITTVNKRTDNPESVMDEDAFAMLARASYHESEGIMPASGETPQA